jgi:hypothetical protein
VRQLQFSAVAVASRPPSAQHRLNFSAILKDMISAGLTTSLVIAERCCCQVGYTGVPEL